MKDTLLTLAQFHYWLGYIGYDEYCERCCVAHWLGDESGEYGDPRIDESDESNVPNEQEHAEFEGDAVSVRAGSNRSSGKEDEPLILELTLLGTWIFTKSDRDPYPSVPHGHDRNQTKAWPKLNPYTGRVFTAKHQENKSMRLSKRKMKEIWSDKSFRSFCREMIVWYQETHLHFRFPVKNPHKLPRW